MDLNRLHRILSSIFLILALLQVLIRDVQSQGAGGLAVGLGMDFMVDTPLGELPNPLLTLVVDGPQQSSGMQPDGQLASGTQTGNVTADEINTAKDDRKMLFTTMDTLSVSKTRANINQTLFNQVLLDKFNMRSPNTRPKSVHVEVVGEVPTNIANINTTNDVKIIDTFADTFESAILDINGGQITNMTGGGPLNPAERLPQDTDKQLTVNMATQTKINQLEASTSMFPNTDIPRSLFVISTGQPNTKIIVAPNTESFLTSLPSMGVNAITLGRTGNEVNYVIPEVSLPRNVLANIQSINQSDTTPNSRKQEAVDMSPFTLPTTEDRSRTVHEQVRDMTVVDNQTATLESQSTMVRSLARNIGIDALVNDRLPQSQSTSNHYSKTETSTAIDLPFTSPQEIKPLNSKSSDSLDRRTLKKHIDSLMSNAPNVGYPGISASVSDMFVQQEPQSVIGETSTKLNTNKSAAEKKAHFSQSFQPVVGSNFGVKNTFSSNVQESGIIKKPALDFMTTFLNNAKQPTSEQVRNFVDIVPTVHGSSNVGTSSDIRTDGMQEPNLNVDQFGVVDVHTRKQLNSTQWETFMSSLASNQKAANVEQLMKTTDVATDVIKPFKGNGKTLLTLSEMNMQLNGDIAQPVSANQNNVFERAAYMGIDGKDIAVSTFEAPGITGHKSVAITGIKLRPSANIPNNSRPANNRIAGKSLDANEQQQLREFTELKTDGGRISSTFTHLDKSQRLPNQHAMKTFSTNWENQLPLSHKVGSIQNSLDQHARDTVDNMQNELKTFNLGRSILISDGVVPSFAKPNKIQGDQVPVEAESRQSISPNGIKLSRAFLTPDSQNRGEVVKVDKVVNISKTNLDFSTQKVGRKNALAVNKFRTDQIGFLTNDLAEPAITISKSNGSQPGLVDIDHYFSHKNISSNNNPSTPAVIEAQKISQPIVLNSNGQRSAINGHPSTPAVNEAQKISQPIVLNSNGQRSVINGQSKNNGRSSINSLNDNSPLSTFSIGKSSGLQDQLPTSLPSQSLPRNHMPGSLGIQMQTSNQQSMEATKYTSGSRFAVFGPANDINGRSFASSRSMPQSSEMRVGVAMSPLECRYQKDPMSEFYFLHHNGGDIHRFRCALGTKFDPLTCECSIRTSDVGDCLEVHMDFNNGVVEDSSLQRLPIGNENVEITNKSSPLSGIALFGGDAKLTIWRYQNYDFRDHVMLKVQFQPAPGGDRYQPLISNCDADMDGPSVGILYDSILKEVLLILKTINETVKELKFTVNPNEWNDVTYIYDGQEFIGIVNGVRRYISRQDPHLLGIIGGEIKSVPVQGLIEIRDAAIVLGSCPGSGHFRGAMVDIQIYTCIPKDFRLE